MARPSFPEFGQRLRQLFQQKGITNQSAFARANGFQQKQVNRWLHGSLPEKRRQRERLAQALGLDSFEELLVGAPAPEETARKRARRALDQDVQLLELAVREHFGAILRQLDPEQRQRVVQHVREQVVLLADLIRRAVSAASLTHDGLRAFLLGVPTFAQLTTQDQQSVLAKILGTNDGPPAGPGSRKRTPAPRPT